MRRISNTGVNIIVPLFSFIYSIYSCYTMSKRSATVSRAVQMQCKQHEQQESLEHRHTHSFKPCDEMLQSFFSFSVVAATSVLRLCGFTHAACSLPLPDSSRAAVISVDGSVVESGTRSAALPGAVLRHLGGLLLLAGCHGDCLLMMELETTGRIHVARTFRAQLRSSRPRSTHSHARKAPRVKQINGN